MGNLVDGKLDLGNLKYLPSGHGEFPDLFLEHGDVLFNRTNSAELVGKTAVYRGVPKPCSFASYLIRLRLEGAMSEWLSYYLNSPFGRSQINAVVSQQVGQANVNGTKLKAFQIPLPPLAEQRRIVAKIEELFSELDAGEESLRRARRQLGVYRQSLLKQAFEGKLTEQWRKHNPHLLEDPDAPWHEVEVSEVLTSKPTNGRSVKDRTGGFKVLRLTALRGGKIDLREYKEGDWDAAAAANHVVRKGDFLLSRGNGSIKLVGRGGVVMENADIAFPDTMIRLPLDLRLVDPSFFVYLWNSEQVRRQVESSARTTAGIYKINQSLLTRYRLPLCSLPEQHEIVRLLDEQFTVIEQNEREIAAALKRSAALRQSILKKAFTGQLVPQDPTDEPASALLERIRKERDVAESTSKKKITRKKSLIP
jgi:type I restriction enzyme S subunit